MSAPTYPVSQLVFGHVQFGFDLRVNEAENSEKFIPNQSCMSTITATLPSSNYTPVVSSVSPAGIFATQASNLANDSSIIATIGGATSTTPLYTAQGLMNSFLQAASISANSDKSSTPTSTSSDSSSNTTSFNGTPDWATVLKSMPSLTSTYLNDSNNQLILNGLSVFA